MRIDQLKFFLALARHRSYHVAAAHLGVTQQALSSSIKALENEFKATLIKRSRSGCTLTADGELFLHYARKSLDDYERIRSYFGGRSRAGAARGRSLDVIFTNSFLSTCVSGAISAFSREYPDIAINVKVMNDRKMEEYIRKADHADYVFLRSVPFAEDGEILREFMPEGRDIQLLKKNLYLACVSRRSILADEREISLRAILDFPMVLSSEKGQTCTPLQAVLNLYRRPTISMTTPSFFSWAQAVGQNIGVGFTQEIFIRLDLIRKVLADEVHFIRLKEKIGAYLGVTLPPSPNPEVRYLFDKITSTLEDPNGVF